MRLPFFLPIFSYLVVISAFFISHSPAQAAVTLNAQEQVIASSLRNESGQHRPAVNVDPVLTVIARQRAADMAQRGYVDHTNPDGDGPNRIVERAGYLLPDSYPDNGNNIESIAAGESSAEDTWSSWMSSEGHRAHLLAEHSFYAAQTAVGVGYHYDPASEYRHYWVVITAPPQAGTQLVITSPAADAKVTDSQVAIRGTASGSSSIASVQYRLENAVTTTPFRMADGVGSWSGSIGDLAPGRNTLRVRCVSGGGAVLKEVTRAVTYVVLEPLTVTTSGEGQVSGSFLGTTVRQVGKKYAIIAAPAEGWLFNGWTGSIVSAKREISFTMGPGFGLTANFIPNPFLSHAGVYQGLVQEEARTHATSGFLRAKVTSNGAFTGRMTIGAVSYSFQGRFSSSGTATVALPRAGQSPLIATLQLDVTNGTDRITGTISDGTFTTAVSADLNEAMGSEPAVAAGRYTVRVAADSANISDQVPQGDGYAAVVVDARGRVKIIASLADGTRFTQGAAVSGSGTLPIYAALYAGKGSVIGTVTFRDSGITDLDGGIHWSKPNRPAAQYHRAAFEIENAVFGSRYIVPHPGTPVVQVSLEENNAQLVLGAGNLETPIIQSATLDAHNQVVLAQPAPRRLSIKINALSGRFTGTFVHPVTGLLSPFQGAIFQKQNAGFGYFLGIDRSGYTMFAVQ